MGVRTFGMSTSMNTNDPYMGIQRWVGECLEINAFRFKIGVYNVKYTNVNALIIGKGVKHF